jgi:uncharacterized membrane protein
MHEWDNFSVVLGGSAGALVGLLFVAMSIHAAQIAGSADLRNRAAQTMVIFATLLLVSLLLSIPPQPDWLLGTELLVLAVGVGILLIILGRLAGQSDSRSPIARTLQTVNPSTLTAVGVALTGALMLSGVEWAAFVLVPTACAAMVGGLASAFLLLTRLTD